MRSPHRTPAAVLLLLLAALTPDAAAAAKTYSADRFDSTIRVLPGGALEVTERVVFRFESGTFDHVFREISTDRTDGIDVIEASMDGQALPFGTAVNQVEISARSRTRVQWRFSPVADSAHLFVLRYVARGAAFREGQHDVVIWRALPVQHEYRIASSTIRLELPTAMTSELRGTPAVEWHRSDGAVVSSVGPGDLGSPDSLVGRATAASVRRNGWIEVRLELPVGALTSSPPAWQTWQAHARALTPRWMTAAAVICCSGLIVLAGLRQQYDAPGRNDTTAVQSPDVPDSLAPGLVGPLLSNGRVRLEHAMAVLFSLAERGVVTIEEQPHHFFGRRGFVVRTRETSRTLATHEAAVLTIGAAGGNPDQPVPLSTFRNRLERRLRRFRRAAVTDLLAAGLVEPSRISLRDRYTWVAVLLIVIGGLGFVAAGAAARTYGGAPFLVPAALVLLGVAASIFAAATTALSNEGLRRAARWRGFRTYLKQVTRNQAVPAQGSLQSVLPIVVAAGLAPQWSKYLERHPGAVPPWFRALSAASQDHAFAAFVTSGGAGAHGGGGAGAGAAAGGGASGAG